MEYQDIKQLLNQDYNSENWKKIITAIFPDRDFFTKKEDVSDFYTDKQQNDFESIHQFGDISLNGDRKLALFEVKLPSKKKIAQNRVNLRSLVAKLVMPGITAGALVVFYAEEQKDWRFSFLYKDVKFEDGKEQKTETHPKRYTYVLGEHETCKTPAKQFSKLIDKQTISINDILDAFSVEKLSKEFFDKYKSFYKKFTETISNNPSKRALFENEKQISDFVKKMLGRVVFLYFIQKKGWLGIGSQYSKNPDAENYGEGDFQFLRNLLENSEKNELFYANYLAPLFYETLNTERDKDLCRIENKNFGRVPFLNGGLFENDFENYKQLTFDFEDFDNLFSFFEEYNFTIDENSIDDFDIGIDPEMLGHIFENLLDDNKDKGTFYTPKEIVHYMCQESLAEYLKTKLNNKQAETSIENLLKNKDVDAYTKEHAQEIDNYLNDVKICDPAIGSGAFPIGLLLEIFQAKMYLHFYAHPRKAWIPAKVKKNIIQNSIYGVDIERGAVDIARLRFWLSLIVDEEIEIGEKPKPLPNLDYKIMQGNSLLESFEGIDLSGFTENGKDDEPNGELFSDKVFEPKVEYEKSKKAVGELINEYFKETDKDIKDDIHNKIDNIINGFIKKTIAENEKEVQKTLTEIQLTITNIQASTTKTEAQKQKKVKALERNAKLLNTTLKKLDKIKLQKTELLKVQKTRERPYFLWHLYFKDVFDNGGFDIVIGNPPYVRQERLGMDYKNILIKSHKEVGNGIADLYVYFYSQGLKILKTNGNLAFITLNKWLKTKYGKELRNYLTNFYVDKVIDFFELPVFEASTDTLIALIKKSKSEKTKYFPIETLKNLDLHRRTKENFKIAIKDESEWKFVNPNIKDIVLKIEQNKIPLKEFVDDKIFRGITTGMNRAFIIDNSTKEKICNEEPKSKEIIKKYIQPTSIKKYNVEWKGDWFINSHNGVKELNISPIDVKMNFPAIYKWLSSHLPEIKQRQDKGKDWSNLRNCAYIKEFDKSKLIYIHTSTQHEFYFDEENYFINNSCYMIVTESKFLWAFLNSKLFNWYKKIKFVAYGDANTSGRAKLDYNKMITIPIVNINNKQEEEFDALYREITKSGKDTTALEAEIDQMVYKLYDLTEEEIELIENPEKAKERKQKQKELEAKRTEQAKKFIAQIEKGENQTQELKSTLAYCLRQKSRQKYIEHEAMKNIAAFLNSKGGTLFIGVDDDKNILGLENDFSTFRKDDKIDEFQKHLDNLIQSYLGDHIHDLLNIDFPKIDDKLVCKIDVKPASSPKMLINKSKGNEEEFYVRRSASAIKLSPSEMIKYIKEHWG